MERKGLKMASMNAAIQTVVDWLRAVEYVTVQVPNPEKATSENFSEPKGSPHRCWMEFKPPMAEMTVQATDWSLRRRSKVAWRSALLGSGFAALVWGLAWLLTGSVPETAKIVLGTDRAALTLPFAISSLWDIPSFGLWVGTIGLLITYSSELSAYDRKITKMQHFLLFSGLYGGLTLNLTFGMVYGLFCWVGIILIFVYAGLLTRRNVVYVTMAAYSILVHIIGLGMGCYIALAIGLTFSLPFLVFTIIAFVPIVVVGHRILARERIESDIKKFEATTQSI